MMDPRMFVRRLVSQNKKRLQFEGFDLDLSYITDQIIAMGLPSTGVESQYRNPIEEVVRFLEEHHKGKYKVFNLCMERQYDPAVFGGFMANFPFDDHNCPALEMIPAFCRSAKDWMKLGMDYVVCIHCKAGKSRTGLMICALLMHLGYYETPDPAINFYNKRRTHDMKGLVGKSQIRYVRYYHHVLNHGLPPHTPRILNNLTIDGTPGWSNVTMIVFLQNRDVVWTGVGIDRTPARVTSFECGCNLDWDFKIEFREKERVLFYFWLNAFFVEDVVILLPADVDKLKESVGPDFKLILTFSKGPEPPPIEQLQPQPTS
jgi:phosphatidylinositol-3,4,5-trisphosphate 3-phosphatase/dual-specificity protein phosphatase PTEN